MTRPCLPPRDASTPVSFALPPGACDSHAHVFGPYDRFPLADDRSYTPGEYPGEAFVAGRCASSWPSRPAAPRTSWRAR
jgi:2-pyrone-4,6-dicarboxylate lactonase